MPVTVTSATASYADWPGKVIGMIVLKADESLEDDLRRLLTLQTRCHISRIESPDTVDEDSLMELAARIAQSSALLPSASKLCCAAFACTSASCVIGSDRVSALIREGCKAETTTNPLLASVASCRGLSVDTLGLVTPYVREVNSVMIDQFSQVGGITVTCLVSFGEDEDAKVARIDPESIYRAAVDLEAQNKGKFDALFLSCTNLRTLDIINRIEEETSLPCLSR